MIAQIVVSWEFHSVKWSLLSHHQNFMCIILNVSEFNQKTSKHNYETISINKDWWIFSGMDKWLHLNKTSEMISRRMSNFSSR